MHLEDILFFGHEGVIKGNLSSGQVKKSPWKLHTPRTLLNRFISEMHLAHKNHTKISVEPWIIHGGTGEPGGCFL